MSYKKKCYECDSKIKNVLPFICKCNHYFCNRHRYPDHKCNFDHHEYHKENVSKTNPKLLTNMFKKI